MKSLFLIEESVLVCKHVLGVVSIEPSQDFVFIHPHGATDRDANQQSEGNRVLVEPNPEGRPIAHCPNYGITIKPCTFTLKVEEGYSNFVRIGGKRVCLQTVTGLTDGTPPGIVKFVVKTPAQQFVSEGE